MVPQNNLGTFRIGETAQYRETLPPAQRWIKSCGNLDASTRSLAVASPTERGLVRLHNPNSV
jgi:hypothetical protein